MGQRSNYAAAKDAQILFRREECVGGTEQSSSLRNAAAKTKTTGRYIVDV